MKKFNAVFREAMGSKVKRRTLKEDKVADIKAEYYYTFSTSFNELVFEQYENAGVDIDDDNVSEKYDDVRSYLNDAAQKAADTLVDILSLTDVKELKEAKSTGRVPLSVARKHLAANLKWVNSAMNKVGSGDVDEITAGMAENAPYSRGLGGLKCIVNPDDDAMIYFMTKEQYEASNSKLGKSFSDAVGTKNKIYSTPSKLDSDIMVVVHSTAIESLK